MAIKLFDEPSLYCNKVQLRMKISIEYCTNCKNHQWNTRHCQAKYLDLFKVFEEKFRGLGYQVESLEKPRLGSFQISLGEYNLYSKLQNGLFPMVDSVVRFIDDFNKIPNKDKWEKYQEIKSKKEKKEGVESKILSLPPVAHRGVSFSPMKHRQLIKQFAQSQKMSNILGKTRREASQSGNRTRSVFNPSSTSRSRFLQAGEDKFRQTNPQWRREESKLESRVDVRPSEKSEQKVQVNMRDPFQHDDIFLSGNKSDNEQQPQKVRLESSNNNYQNNQFERQDSQEPKQNEAERQQTLKQLEVNGE